MAIKITEEEYKKKFGAAPTQPTPQKTGFGQRTKEAFNTGVSKVKDVYKQPAKNPLQFVENIGKLGAGVAEVAFSPVTAAAEPAIRPTIGKAVNYAANKLSDSPAVQKFATSKAGQATSRIAQTISDYSTIAGSVTGPKAVRPAVGGALTKTGQVVNKAAQPIKTVARDVIPTTDRMISHQVTHALDLTQGDVSTIARSTGHEVGRFMADHNLIKQNKATSMAAVDDFYKQNYQAVRAEINKVPTIYKPSQVPRYVEALKAVKGKIEKVPGQQQAAVEVDRLLGKKQGIKLADVQRVKEIMDDHFNLYKATGDVGEGVAKEGLANVRKDLKKFIETEVKKGTGSDIADLNNKVSTSRGILDAVEARSTRGLTRSNIRLGDLGIFGAGTVVGGPLVGIAAVFGKKLLEAPAVRLRIAKFMDKISDARKARIKAELEAGKIPQDFKQFIKQGRGGPGAMAKGDLERTQTIKGSMSVKNLRVHEDAPDLSRIEMYKNNLQAKQPVDRIKVIRERGGYGVEDGKHRLAAYKELGYDRVPVEIIKKNSRYTKGKGGRFTGSASNIK